MAFAAGASLRGLAMARILLAFLVVVVGFLAARRLLETAPSSGGTRDDRHYRPHARGRKRSRSQPHHFLSVTKGGHSAIFSTSGNEDCHIILRGGKSPNYDRASVDAACREAGNAALACRLMIDCSHGNSQKNPDNQLLVAQDIVDQLSEGDARIFGVMVESHLVAGREDLVTGRAPTYGRSITDGCLGWEATEQALELLAEGVAERRIALAQ